ncbi:hypothetical protein AN958_00048 [Leucoagaricus sp. SymC.cos]|nr:hypothetical protein AN958_00048 [Leucoagaricus sp. SymC.cos]
MLTRYHHSMRRNPYTQLPEKSKAQSSSLPPAYPVDLEETNEESSWSFSSLRTTWLESVVETMQTKYCDWRYGPSIGADERRVDENDYRRNERLLATSEVSYHTNFRLDEDRVWN